MTQQTASERGDPARLAACVQALGEFLDEQLEALLGSARDAVLVRARDADDRDEEERLLSVLEEVEALAPVACEAFREKLVAKVRSPEEGLSDPSDDEDDTGLALVDTSKVDDWVRMRKILRRHSAAAKALEAGLRVRLAHVAGTPPHPNDFPVSLPGVCMLFQSEMQKLRAGREARDIIYDAFESTVVAKLGTAVSRLDNVLQDVAPPSAEEPPSAGTSGLETSGAAVAPSRTVRLDDDEDSVEPMRLLGAIAAVERQMRFVSGERARNTEELEGQLAEALTPPGVVLGEPERVAVAAVARLLQHSLDHPGIDDAVRSRLWRLAPPLVLLALQDEGYLDLELQAARHDPLTGLLDRAAFRARLEGTLGRGRWAHAVCLIDVDGFGAIVDAVGQQAAGRLLRALADLLRQQAGSSARVARLRGDEFGVLLPARRSGAGRRFARRYSNAVKEVRFVVAGKEVRLGLSIGVVEADSGLATSAEIMRAADKARMAAKRDGGGCVRVYADIAGD